MKVMMILLIAIPVLIAEEPILGTLTGIENNRYLNFRIEQIAYRCQPYGVETLEELSQNNVFASKCRDVIDSFYQAHPESYHFAQNRLRRYQRYHLEIRRNSCIIYAMGMRSYAELLLEEGLALQKPSENDEILQYRFRHAQEMARSGKKGVWSETKWSKCAEGHYSRNQ